MFFISAVCSTHCSLILACVSSLYVLQAISQASFLPYIYRKGGRSGASHICRTCRGCGVKVSYRQLGPGMSQQLQSRCPDCRGEGEVTGGHTALQLQKHFVLSPVAFIVASYRTLCLVLILTPYPLRSVLISSCLRLGLPRGKNT